MFNIFQRDYDLFRYALSQLTIGQVVRLSGKNQFGGQHTLDTFIVDEVSEDKIITTTGLTFHYTDLNHIAYTQGQQSTNTLLFADPTGHLETFPSEPE